jgi:hypothetical protein
LVLGDCLDLLWTLDFVGLDFAKDNIEFIANVTHVFQTLQRILIDIEVAHLIAAAVLFTYVLGRIFGMEWILQIHFLPCAQT